MKITIDYKESSARSEQLQIDSAKYLSDYVIRIKFSDGHEQFVDFKAFLLTAIHPSIKKYLDESKFSNFSLTNGNLNWNDYDLIFPISDSYSGKLET